MSNAETIQKTEYEKLSEEIASLKTLCLKILETVEILAEETEDDDYEIPDIKESKTVQNVPTSVATATLRETPVLGNGGDFRERRRDFIRNLSVLAQRNHRPKPDVDNKSSAERP